MEKRKSRDQSLFEFLQCLQLEYANAELRSKIYPSQKDKRYYRKVMGWKEDKIIDIASRNQLPTIFTDESIKSDIYSQVWGTSGCPDFIYRDDREIDKFQINDIKNYFSEGAEVKILKEGGKFAVGVIVDNEALLDFLDKDFLDGLEDVPLAIKERGHSVATIAVVNQISRIL